VGSGQFAGMAFTLFVSSVAFGTLTSLGILAAPAMAGHWLLPVMLSLAQPFLVGTYPSPCL